jgi:hypothetical protein
MMSICMDREAGQLILPILPGALAIELNYQSAQKKQWRKTIDKAQTIRLETRFRTVCSRYDRSGSAYLLSEAKELL